MTGAAQAYFRGRWATGLREVVDLVAHPEALDSGWWAVAAAFEGAVTGYRFDRVRVAPPPAARKPWIPPGPWVSSLNRAAYVSGVRAVRQRIAAGTVYQVNLCRALCADLDPAADPVALFTMLAVLNPAPYQGFLITDQEWVVTASPELFLSRSGDQVISGPIKGTAALGVDFAAKDFPENIMITDLVRNDLGRVARPGSVGVEVLATVQDHPGLRHLVSVIRADLRPSTGWHELWAAMFPPGSVSGAPKHTALQVISELEPVDRGLYCGALGYVDGEAGEAELAVGIRTFFTTGRRSRLHFGTGAGITWASQAAAEWRETELKAARLIAVTAGVQPRPPALTLR